MEHLPTLWVLKHKIRNEAGFPIEFSNHQFLWDMYNDMSPLQVWLKPPQIGATVCKTLKSMYVAKKFKRQIIYTLPTQGDVHEMVGGSINRIIAQNPILMDWVRDHDTVEQKQVGDSMIFYRGTWTAKQAMMIPSGLNIHDEVDASDAAVITQYETRLQAQKDGGWRWYFSHPSLSGFGVDIYWQQSDKKEWFIECPNCQGEFDMQWPRNVSREHSAYICHLCQHILSDDDRKKGKWIKTADGIFSGYHVSQLMCPWISARKVIEAFDDPLKDTQYFYNYVLGLPYIASESKIPSEAVLRNVTREVNSQEGRIIIGVDTGLPIHFTCLNKEGVFYYGSCKPPSEDYDPYDELRRLLRLWPKAVIVADQGGDLIGIRKLQAEFKGRVFLVWYRKDKKSQEVARWGKDDDYGTVVVDRNRMMQLVIEQLRDIGRIQLNGDREDWLEWAGHFDNIYRELVVVKETKDKDIKTLYGNEYIWKRNGPDHYVHTLVYALVGLNRFSGDMATIVGDDEFAELPTGRFFSSPSPEALAQAIKPKPPGAVIVPEGYGAGDFAASNQADL